MIRNYMAMFIICGILFAGCQSNAKPGKEESNVDFNENDFQKIVEANNQLGLQMVQELKTEDNENIFISPISQYMAFSMLYQGADGETKSELAKLLKVNKQTAEDINKANASLLKKLKSDDKGLQLHIANSLWVDNDYELKKDYQHTINDYYQGTIEPIDGSNKADTEKINKWVAEKTNHKIKKMADGPLGDDFAAMLVNAVYFKGNWTFPFDPDATSKDTFHSADGKTAKVPFMHMHKKLDYLKTDNFEAVRLPYGEEGDQQMYLFLPKESEDIHAVHTDLLESGIIDTAKKMEEREGTIALPKFKTSYEEDLTEALKDLGVDTAFNKNKAEFPHIIKGTEPLFVSEVKHKTFLEINEKGTEASGATSIGMETTSAPAGEPFELSFDRPFFLLILDEKTESILFMGDINNVTE